MKRILVTGGTGYIGSHTVVELIRGGYEVVVIDNLSNSKVEVLDRIKRIAGVRPEFRQVDLMDAEGVREVFAEWQFDAVMHFAGLKAVGESMEKPLEYYEANVAGTVNLLMVMKKFGVKRIVFSSSASVYGEPESLPIRDDARVGVGITSPYGRSKYMVEQVLGDWCMVDAEVEVTSLRYFNPIGAHESGLLGEDPNGVPNNLVPFIAQSAAGKLGVVKVFGDDYETPDGTCVRDYIHITDVVSGHLAALGKMKKGMQTYNLSTGAGKTVLEMIGIFSDVVGRELAYEVVARRVGGADVPVLYASADRASEELGWRTERTVEEAIEGVWKWQSEV
ncbi:UDP-glucose 4-epimerase GalE [Candidatus Saccharibacteria bacterium]|nr:UDP-glucose 4-epimerase GalE [Candidatus Saccharibacteria bacterium]